MKRGFLPLLTIAVLVSSFVYVLLGSKQPAVKAEGVSNYLMPVKVSTMFAKDKVTVFLNTKAALPAQLEDQEGWLIGFDLDAKKETGKNWPKIGADYVLTVAFLNREWVASIKNTKTDVSHKFDGEVMVEKNKVDFSIPLKELESKTSFNWQIAVMKGKTIEVMPDLMHATNKGKQEIPSDRKGMDM